MVRYAVCGLSNRGLASFVLPLVGSTGGNDTVLGYGSNTEDFSTHGQLVAVMDVDHLRVEEFLDRLLPPGYQRPASYTDYDEMLTKARPDTVIITSPDDTHEAYATAALSRNINVIVEKPMTSTAAGARRVLDAEAASASSVRVAHNLRYTAKHRQIKAMLRSGAIGRPVQVSLNYFVDIRHGASYFLRWNRERARSGGLSVHKSAHHIDLVNWWLDAEPQAVYALGGRAFYGPASPHRPLSESGEPVTGDQLRNADPYFQAQRGSGTFPNDSTSARRGLYDLPYHHAYPPGRDDYLYDEQIDIEDHFSALISYPGTSLAYTIAFSAPWEGYRLHITGTHGQIEASMGRNPDGVAHDGTANVILRPLFGPPQEVTVEQALGGHDGADPLLRRDLFIGPNHESSTLSLAASSRQGAVAVAAGEAIWRSIETGRVWTVEELLA